MKIKLRATVLHPEHEVGAIYEELPGQAASDLYLKKAIEVVDEDEHEELEQPKRRYRRRDMTAEK